MKRHGNLFDQAFSVDNLYAAYLDARQGKRMRRACFWFDTRAGAVLDWLRRRLYDFPRRQYSYEWESMNLYTHQRFIDSVKLGNREAAVSIFRIEHWSYEVHKKYFKLYYDFDQKK